MQVVHIAQRLKRGYIYIYHAAYEDGFGHIITGYMYAPCAYNDDGFGHVIANLASPMDGLYEPHHSYRGALVWQLMHRTEVEIWSLNAPYNMSQSKPQAPLLVVPFRQFLLSFSLATILPPEPKDFGFPEDARRVMKTTPPDL